MNDELRRLREDVEILKGMVAALQGRAVSQGAYPPILKGMAPGGIPLSSLGTMQIYRGAGVAGYTAGDDKKVYARLGAVPANSMTYIAAVDGVNWEPITTANCS